MAPKTNKQKFNEKYKQKKDQANSKKDISKLTGIPMKILDEVYDRGMGAYRTNPGSVRPSVKSPQQWSMARVYSFVVKGPTWKGADSDIADKVRKLRIPGYIR